MWWGGRVGESHKARRRSEERGKRGRGGEAHCETLPWKLRGRKHNRRQRRIKLRISPYLSLRNSVYCFRVGPQRHRSVTVRGQHTKMASEISEVRYGTVFFPKNDSQRVLSGTRTDVSVCGVSSSPETGSDETSLFFNRRQNSLCRTSHKVGANCRTREKRAKESERWLREGGKEGGGLSAFSGPRPARTGESSDSTGGVGMVRGRRDETVPTGHVASPAPRLERGETARPLCPP